MIKKKVFDFELVRCEQAKDDLWVEDGLWIAEVHFQDCPYFPSSQKFGAVGVDKYDALWKLAQFVNDIH